MASLLDELRRRRVGRALLAYGAGVAVVLQGADWVFTALALPDLAYRLVVISAMAGFPLVAVLSWVYDLTARGLRRDGDISPEERQRFQPSPVHYLTVIGAFTVAAVIVAATSGAVSSLRYPAETEGRVALAIFPLRAVGAGGAEWSEGLPDLLATALDGTPSLRVVDPWALWRPLRAGSSAAPRTPDIDEAEELARGTGAHRFLLGSVVHAGASVEVTFRLYRVGRSEPLDAFTVSVAPDELVPAVRQAAVRVLARAWGPRRPPDVPSELDFDATQSPEALKAYLAAREALRRGMVDSANTAIDRALVLDSAFVLAMVDAVQIKSWVLSTRGQAYGGLLEILERAGPYEATLAPRSRLRLEAHRASVRTDGPTAIRATTRILELDPLDYGANASLEYFHRVYGWQLVPPVSGSREMAERVVQLDSTQVPALLAREWWAVTMGDAADQRAQLQRLQRVESGDLAQGAILGLRAILADSSTFEGMLPAMATLRPTDYVSVARHLRIAAPSRFRRLLAAVESVPESPLNRTALEARLRLDLAQGWAARVGSELEAGLYTEDQRAARAAVEMRILAADLAGMGDRAASERALQSLSAHVPVDSALAYFQEKNVWQSGWLMGAWHAQLGDTAVARRWVDALGTFPEGGTSEDYRGALQADIEARLATRRQDGSAALKLARDALSLWTIHTDNAIEDSPSPLMRLNLALLLRDAGRGDEAAALLSSLVPPITWVGFLTVRASYELGALAEGRGDAAAATTFYRSVVGSLDEAGPAASPWVEQARSRLDARR